MFSHESLHPSRTSAAPESPLLARRSLHAVLCGCASDDFFSAQALRTADSQSAVCGRRAGEGQLRKLRRTQAFLRTHTQPGPGRVYSRELPPPPASLPTPEWLLMENLPTVPNRPNFSHIIFVGGICGGITDLMSNISATRGQPDIRFCACESPRGDLSP